MKNINKLFMILVIASASSQIVQADGFFNSVGNVATLGEVNRSKERKKKSKAEQNKQGAKKKKQLDSKRNYKNKSKLEDLELDAQ